MTLNYAGQAGQPTWLWGTNDGSNAYVWNPSNFSVNYANSAGYASSAGNANTVTNGVYNDGGTYSINITGSAGYASSAGSAPANGGYADSAGYAGSAGNGVVGFSGFNVGCDFYLRITIQNGGTYDVRVP
jgi:hypothetical protein